MAFNPFNAMRKNSKAILAVVTILIMFIFVLSSGIRGGDFFNDVLPRWFGAERTKVPPLVTFDGTEIRSGELERLRVLRRMANDYMLIARERANIGLLRDVERKIENGRLTEDTKRAVETFVKAKLRYADPPREYTSNDQMRAFQAYQQTLQQFSFLQEPMLREIVKKTKETNQDDYEACLAVLSVFSYDAVHENRRLMRQFGVGPEDQYFELPNSTLRQQIDYLLLLKKADKLGIQYPTESVKSQIEQETFGQFRGRDAGLAEQRLRLTYKDLYTADTLLQTLGNEFRARAAFAALQGIPASLRSGSLVTPPSYLTPYEFYQFYKDQCSEMTVNMLEVPVDSFLAKVTETPTEDELKKLYNKHRLQEKDPGRETPGFKESRKIKIEWLSGDSKMPYYTNAMNTLEATKLFAASMQPATMLGGTPSIAACFMMAEPSFGRDLDVVKRYKEKADDHNRFHRWDMDSSYFFRARDTSVYHPLPLANLAAHLAGPMNPMKDLLAAAAFSQGVATIEIRDRTKVGMPIVLASLVPSFSGPLTAIIPSVGSIPPYLPQAAFEAKIKEDVREDRLADLYLNDMKAFRKKLDDLARSKDKDGKDKKPEVIKAEASTYIAEFVKTRGLKFGASQELRDKFTIADDPRLAPLKEKAPPRPGEAVSEFESVFFSDSPTGRTVSTLYDPKWFPGGEFDPAPFTVKTTNFLAWRSEDVAPRSYITYEQAPQEVKEKVILAWKREKARALAKAEADKLAEKTKEIAKAQLVDANNPNGFRGNLLDAILKTGMDFKTFDLGPMAVLTYQQNFQQPGRPGQYTTYTIPRKDILYPGTIADQLLEIRTKPLGETIVVSDMPKSHFYVATILNKKEKELGDFTREVFTKYSRSTSGPITEMNPLYMAHARPKALGQDLEAVIARLKSEFKYSEDPEQVKNLDKNQTVEE